MEVKFYMDSKFNLLIDKSHGFEGCLSCCVRKTDSILFMIKEIYLQVMYI